MQSIIETIDTTIAVLDVALRAIAQHARDARSLEPDLQVLLAELASSHDDTDAHHERFPDDQGKEWEDQSQACREHWKACFARRGAAERAVLDYARAVRATAQVDHAAVLDTDEAIPDTQAPWPTSLDERITR